MELKLASLVNGTLDALAGLSPIVAQFYDGSRNGNLDRLKMCASDECRRVFIRPVETRDPAMVHVIAVREPDEDAKLSGTATRRMIVIRRLLPGLSTRFATK
jgi:hypothetical protein